MTDQPGGRQKPPADDRTLLDPLNADELRALREARAKMQAAKGGSGPSPQVVTIPQAGDGSNEATVRAGAPQLENGGASLSGDAPARGVALPQFENNGVSLDKINTRGQAKPAASAPRPDPAQTAQTALTSQGGSSPAAPMPGVSAQPVPPQPGGPPGPGGFGENTLLWMAPPKVAPAAQPLAPVAGLSGEMPKVSAPQRHLKAIGVAIVAIAVVGGLVAVGGKKEKTVIELHTNPSKAIVKINGEKQGNAPMKLTLAEGTWDIELSLDGYKTETFSLESKGGTQRKDIELEPISQAGRVTVGISVQPIVANIEIDGTVYEARRSVSVANLDPKVPHKIVIEAGGYKKVQQDIPAGQIKEKYNFLLQEDGRPK